MPTDSDPIAVSNRPDDFTALITDGISGIQYKLILFLFLIFLIITSDVFTNRVLTKFKGAVDYKYPTNYGTVLQGVFLVLFYIVIDVGIRHKII